MIRSGTGNPIRNNVGLDTASIHTATSIPMLDILTEPQPALDHVTSSTRLHPCVAPPWIDLFVTVFHFDHPKSRPALNLLGDKIADFASFPCQDFHSRKSFFPIFLQHHVRGKRFVHTIL